MALRSGGTSSCRRIGMPSVCCGAMGTSRPTNIPFSGRALSPTFTCVPFTEERSPNTPTFNGASFCGTTGVRSLWCDAAGAMALRSGGTSSCRRIGTPSWFCGAMGTSRHTNTPFSGGALSPNAPPPAIADLNFSATAGSGTGSNGSAIDVRPDWLSDRSSLCPTTGSIPAKLCVIDHLLSCKILKFHF